MANSVLIRRECLEHLGGFDESLRFGDYLLWMRLARHYKIDHVEKVVTQYRQHASQSTQNVSVGSPDEESVGIQSIRRILELYPAVREELGERTIRRRLGSLYFDLAYSWFNKRTFANARLCLAKSIRFWPSNVQYLLYDATLLPRSLVRAGRQEWCRARDVYSRMREDRGKSRPAAKCDKVSCG